MKKTSILSATSVIALLFSNASYASEPYDQGVQDWKSLSSWFNAQTSDRFDGAQFWAANRNVPGHKSCDEASNNSAFVEACKEAKKRLDPIDSRRRSDAEYKLGFSDEAKQLPLQDKPSSSNNDTGGVWIPGANIPSGATSYGGQVVASNQPRPQIYPQPAPAPTPKDECWHNDAVTVTCKYRPPEAPKLVEGDGGPGTLGYKRMADETIACVDSMTTPGKTCIDIMSHYLQKNMGENHVVAFRHAIEYIDTHTTSRGFVNNSRRDIEVKAAKCMDDLLDHPNDQSKDFIEEQMKCAKPLVEYDFLDGKGLADSFMQSVQWTIDVTRKHFGELPKTHTLTREDIDWIRDTNKRCAGRGIDCLYENKEATVNVHAHAVNAPSTSDRPLYERR